MYNIYLPLTGSSYIAAKEEEISDKEDVIDVTNPVVVTRATDGIGYAMTPIQFLPAPVMYKSGLLFRGAMPNDMVPYYEKYVEHVEAERKNRP